MAENSDWGGVREGAGRPKKADTDKKAQVTVTLSHDVLLALDAYAEAAGLKRSQAVETLLSLALQGGHK